MNRLAFFLLPLTFAGLAACNSGGSSGGDTQTPPTPPAAPLDTVSARIEADGPVDFSTTASVLRRNGRANTARIASRQPVSFRFRKSATDDSVVLVTALGREVKFDPDDLSTSGFEYGRRLRGGTRVYLFTFDGTWAQVENGSSRFDHMVRVGVSDVVENINTRTYGVFGVRTTAAQLPTSGSASYREIEGMRAEVYGSTDSANASYLIADVAVDMDFATSQVSGNFSNLRFPSGGRLDLTLAIDPATVSNGAFQTTLTAVNGEPGQALASSNVNGAFYGPKAEEVGGDFSFTSVATADSIPAVAAGVFGARQ
ncbi:MAG: transferrin-binding protein-like solute binding protein [Pseudomonadota bacterium]